MVSSSETDTGGYIDELLELAPKHLHEMQQADHRNSENENSLGPVMRVTTLGEYGNRLRSDP